MQIIWTGRHGRTGWQEHGICFVEEGLGISATIDAVGIDGSTLFATDLKITQEWAERIARHPSSFDGIVYPSRHTFQTCVVLRNRPGSTRDLEREMVFNPDGDFIFSKPAYESATAQGLKLAFV